MIKRAGAKSALINIRQTDDGLHLANSILWFDSSGSGELSFLSSATSKAAAKGPQVIATEETVGLLGLFRKKPTALICQYNRPFSIGRLKMELLPSGSVLGGASLYVETEKGRLLYAPQLQMHRIPTLRQMQLKRANTLILSAAHPDPTTAMPSRKKERERLVETVKSYVSQKEWPVILAEPLSTAPEVTKLLSEAGINVSVHDSIYRINHLYETYGADIGDYTCYNRKRRRPKVTIFPMPLKKNLVQRHFIPEGPLFCIEDTLELTLPPSALRPVEERFFLSTSCDGVELREVVSAVQPKELYIFGPYAKRYVEEFANTCSVIRPLFVNDQPTLF